MLCLHWPRQNRQGSSSPLRCWVLGSKVMHYFQQVFSILKKASAFGELKTAYGTTLLGRAPHLAPNAWLHQLYQPLTSSEVADLESEVAIPFPESFKEFLELSNGIKVFSNGLAVYGLRASFERGSGESWRPFSIISPNLHSRPAGLSRDDLIIGSVSEADSFYLCINRKTEVVFRCRMREDATPLETWPSFGEMLLREVRRLDALNDR